MIPHTRGECEHGERPCPRVSCRYHLGVDVTGVRVIEREGWEDRETCALDVADHGGVTLQEVGDALGCTRERVRQIETAALAKLERHAAKHGLDSETTGLNEVSGWDDRAASQLMQSYAPDYYDSTVPLKLLRQRERDKSLFVEYFNRHRKL